MNKLERLGLEICAFQLLGSRTKAATLCTLLDAAGVTASWKMISKARVWMRNDEIVCDRQLAKVRIHLLRESLEDVGHPGLIVTHPGGYALPEPGRTEIINRLIEVAS